MELISQDGSLMSTVGVNLSEEETDLKKKKKKKKKKEKEKERGLYSTEAKS
jgi:hypothetical protein